MYRITLAMLLALTGGVAAAQEVGRVISSTPVIQQVQVPQQVCTQELAQAPAPTSGAGGVLGAVAGGVIGNTIGQGSGRAAATALGLFGGALLGDRLEGSNNVASTPVQRCTTQMLTESRVVAYQVVYEYAGRQYSAQMPRDPGPQVQLQITPIAATTAPVNTPPAVVSAPPAVVVPAAPPVIVVPAPAVISSTTTWYPAYGYPTYSVPVVRPQIGLDLRFGYGGHRHWR